MIFYNILLSGSYVATACPLGTYGDVKGVVNKSDCTPCPLGTYSNVTGAVNKSDCTDCDEGYYCNVPGGAPTGKCYAGYYCTGRAKVPHQHATEPGNMQIMKSLNSFKGMH